MTKRKNHLKLYVWTGFCPDYTDGLAVAIAKSKEDAEEQILKNRDYIVYAWGTLTVYPLNRRFAVCVSGGG